MVDLTSVCSAQHPASQVRAEWKHNCITSQGHHLPYDLTVVLRPYYAAAALPSAAEAVTHLPGGEAAAAEVAAAAAVPAAAGRGR